jgi:choline dehydrogenase-like flavoprotein
VINSGDIRFQFSEWERSLKEMSDDWLKLSYVSNPYTPAFTSHNDTLKALLGDAINGLDQGYTDMRATSSNFIGRSEDFFNASNPDQPYFKGAFFDYFPGRQSSPEGYRSFPSHYIDRVMAQCGAEKFNASCNTYVTKLLFNNANKGRRAIGVEYIEGSDDVFELDFNYDKTASSSRPTKRAYARRGVILGGGTFESPHILMLNGIGDEKHLADFDIPVRKHLPAVGNNLADDQETVLHYVVTGSDPFAANSAAPGFANKANFIPHGVKLLWGMNPDAFDNITGLPLLPQSTTFTLCHSQAPAYGGRACLPGVVEDPAYLAHLKNETTFYRDSIQAVISVWTLFKSEQERLTRENPSCIAWVEQGIKFKSWWDLRYNYGAAAGSYIAIDVTGSNFGSRGTIRLKSNRSEDAPIIDTAPFSYSQDLTDHASCVNQVRKLISLANELSSINPSIYGNMQLTEAAYPFAPGASVPNDYYTEEIGQWIKDNVWHHHPQGTCQMGKQDTENSVVDSRGRVWGTQNLYVIDASAIAEPFDFFPSTSVMALGFLQAEAMWAKRVPDNAFCNPNDFLSAHDSTNYDVTPNSLEPAVIGLGVTTGVLGLVTLITISFIVFRSMSSPKGYTKIN